MNLLPILLSGLIALMGIACGGEDSVEVDPELLGYWIECSNSGHITGDNDGYAWGVVFKEDGNMIRIRWDGSVVVEDDNGPFDRLKTAMDGEYSTREGSQGTYSFSTATLSTGKSFPLLKTTDGGLEMFHLMVIKSDGSSAETTPEWDCSQEEHETYLAEAQEYDDNLGPIANGCYPVSLSGTLTFESDFSTPRVASINVTFSGGEITAFNGVACEAVFPNQAPTFSDCEIELMCGCCRMKFELQDYNDYYQIEFPRSTSMDACENFVFSGDYTYPM